MKEITMPGLHNELEQIIKELDISYDQPILDIGCGTGAWIYRLSTLGFTSLYGIDKNSTIGTDKGIYCRRNLDIDNWNLPQNNFGLITAIEVIEHLANLDNFFSNIKEYLSKDGYCLISTPNVHALENRLSFLISGYLPAFHPTGDPTHITPILLMSFERLLPRYDLQLVSVKS